MIGLEERDTASGIHVVRLHYTADPRKRSPEWLAEAKRGLGVREWAKEYEIDWSIASGLPVYGEDFNREWHVAKTPIDYVPGLPMYRGWDLGPTHILPACSWGQLHGSCLRILHEFVTWDGRGDVTTTTLPQFAESVIIESNRLFPGAQWIDYVDPAGWAKSQTDGKSCIDILHEAGIHPRKGPITFTDRKRAMIDRLTTVDRGQPALLVDPGCSMTIEGLQGAYKYEEIGETGRYKPSVDKNAWSHIINALEYLVGGLFVPHSRGNERDPDEWRDRRRTRRDQVTGY